MIRRAGGGRRGERPRGAGGAAARDRRVRGGGRLRRRGGAPSRRSVASGPTCSSSTCRCRPSPASSCSRCSTTTELPRVVFVTAHDEFAVRAFEKNAVDYLLKPVERERLARTVERLRLEPGRPRAGRPAALAHPAHPLPVGHAPSGWSTSPRSSRAAPPRRGSTWSAARGALHRAHAAGPRGARRAGPLPQAAPRQRGPGRGDPSRRRGDDAPDPLGPVRPGEPALPPGDPRAARDLTAPGAWTGRSPLAFRRFTPPVRPITLDALPDPGCGCGTPPRNSSPQAPASRRSTTMVWTQIYAPVANSILVSALVAAIPVILLLGALAFFHVKAHWAAVLGLVLGLGRRRLRLRDAGRHGHDVGRATARLRPAPHRLDHPQRHLRLRHHRQDREVRGGEGDHRAAWPATGASRCCSSPSPSAPSSRGRPASARRWPSRPPCSSASASSRSPPPAWR